MKFLVLLPLSAALLVTSCGEKSSSEGSESTGEKATTPSVAPKSLSEADVERLLKEAVESDSLEGRDTIHGNLIYQTNESEPFSGWLKIMYDSGQVRSLAQFKDGKQDGLQTQWHENGQKQAEVIWKGFELVSEKWWNSKGEEVETAEEAYE